MCGIEELYSLGNSLIAMDTHKSKSEILLLIIESINIHASATICWMSRSQIIMICD